MVPLSRPRAKETALWDLLPYDTFQPGGSGLPGASIAPAPSGLRVSHTLSPVFAPPGLTTARQPPQRPWGSPCRALLLPNSGTPLGASPLLSFSPAASCRTATPEVISEREGDRPTVARRRRWPSLALLGFGPSKAFSSTTLGLASQSKPLMPFRPKVLPTFHFRAGLQGIMRVAEAAGLSQGCRPSWGFAPFR